MKRQAGSIVFDGLEATKFWLRTFDLTDTVAEAVGKFSKADPKHTRISCPIISDYRVNKDLLFVFVIVCTCDRIGLVGGSGQVLYASPTEEEKAIKARDELADYVLGEVTKKPSHFQIIEEGEEKDRPE